MGSNQILRNRTVWSLVQHFIFLRFYDQFVLMTTQLLEFDVTNQIIFINHILTFELISLMSP
jgi:hypothetical protein